MTSTLRNDVAAPATDTADRADRLLRLTLRTNAATSLVGGSVMAIGPGPVADLLGTGHPGWVRLVGVLLVPFALGVAWLSTTDRARLRRHVPGIVAGDVAWVVASFATLALGWYSLTGAVVVGGMALAVDACAVLQWWTWRRLAR